MRVATKPQLQKIHYLLNKLGLMGDKREIIFSLTDGRTESSKELSAEEAKTLIVRLCEYDPSERLKSLIFSAAYQAGIIYGTTDADKRINVAKLNLFIKDKGSVKKELNHMTYPELIKTHRQFEAIAKNIRKSKDKKQADTAVSHLLDELNLATS